MDTIIIDRDDEGDETVHFLNMVDESDLLSLMDDEEAQVHIDSIATTEEPVVEATGEFAKEAAEVVEVETEEKGGSNMTGILVLVLVATVGGIGGCIYLKGSKKKDKKQVGPDPDADYKDDEEDYLAGLSEDDDFEDEEIAEGLDEKASEYEEQE